MVVVEYLLDTHTYLWALRGEQKLGNKAKKIILNTKFVKFVSAVSAYEIMYKHQLGKLPEYESIAENYFEALHKFGADELPINVRHAHFAGKFDWTHRDPFDRLLAAQAFTENMALLTNDTAFDALPWLNTLW